MNSIRTQLISFFKEIAPESYHIEDAAYILHIKGADALNNCIKIARQLAKEGILCTTNYQVYSLVPPMKNLKVFIKHIDQHMALY